MDNLDLDKVIVLVKKMNEDVRLGREYNIDFDYLKQKTPRLYDMILAKTENAMEILEFMVSRLKEGKKSQEKSSEEVGEFLASKYIYPNIDMSLENQGSSGSGTK